jgi:hypothetical protein
VASRVTRVEVGYCGATLLLAGLLWLVDRGGAPARESQTIAPAASASAT